MFVRQLAHGRTEWPAQTRNLFRQKLGIGDQGPPAHAAYGLGDNPTEAMRDRKPDPVRPVDGDARALDDWIDLYFIGKRTQCINSLIWYPFGVIALMIVSRSSIFGNFPQVRRSSLRRRSASPIVISCAIALNSVAEDARRFAKGDLADEIVKAKGLGRSRPRLSGASFSIASATCRTDRFGHSCSSPSSGRSCCL